MIGKKLKNFLKAFGHFQTTLLTSLLYYLLVTPIGLVFQLTTFVKKLFIVKPQSYWQPRDHKKDLEDIYQQF